ncbi:unnamed protein product, partial [Candidula unifasciata]
CFLSIVVSGFFTILYSMEWGRDKSNQWLTTFLLSFFQSVIVVQPLKVLLLVAFLACVLKKPELDDDDAKEDINQVLAEKDNNERKRDVASLSQIMLQRQYDKSEFQAPDPEQLAKARNDRLMEIKMEAVLKDIALYTFFVVVIFFLSYQQRDPQSYYLSNHIKNTMLDKHADIKTVNDYWKWLDETLLPSLYAVNYANEQEIENWQDTACASDLDNRRVGVARLRQMRVKNDTCTILPQLTTVIHHCRGDYSWTNDDTKPYLPYWVVPPKNVTESLKDKDDPFVYQSSVKLKNAPYVGTLATYKGGGYVILTKRQFCRTKAVLDKAKENNWLDLNTRAIFLEYTVYNPNSNLFASVTALTEFLTTGSATSRLDVKCVKKVKNERAAYFQDFWRLLEFVLVCFAVACIVLYILKHVITKVAMRALKNRKSDGFVNFNTVALYDEVYGYLMAAVVFLATIQFLKLLQFNKKMGMLGATVQVAAMDLRNFSIIFFLYFLAFTCTAYLLFGSSLQSYQNFVTSAESMFAFALGSFDYGELTTAQPLWGPVFIFG